MEQVRVQRCWTKCRYPLRFKRRRHVLLAITLYGQRPGDELSPAYISQHTWRCRLRVMRGLAGADIKPAQIVQLPPPRSTLLRICAEGNWMRAEPLMSIPSINARKPTRRATFAHGTDPTARRHFAAAPPDTAPAPQKGHASDDLMLEQNMAINMGASASRRKEAELALNTCRWSPSPQHLSKAQLWAVMRDEARDLAMREPMLASFLHMSVITHTRLDRSLVFLLANKLGDGTLLSTQLTDLFTYAYQDDTGLLDAAVADIQAVKDRDPACLTHVQALLFFKGFQALQAHRVAHWMWSRGRRSLALALVSRMSEVFAVDIHPAAVIGRGVMIDHATGVSIGETAVVGDNVVMLHHVTLGGSGTGRGVRHPTIGCGVLLGAGVSVLGPVVVGQCSKVGAGSLVVADLPAHCVAVGVPARVIKSLEKGEEPVKTMDTTSDFILDYII